MLKHVTPLGTTVKERASPPPGQKNTRRRRELEYHGEEQREILELSPLARFMSGFRRTDCKHETKDNLFNFSMEAWHDSYTTRLSGDLKLQYRTWNVAWEINATHKQPSSGAGLVPLMEHFLKSTGAHINENNSFSLTLHKTAGIEALAHSHKELVETLKFFLMQVVVSAALPNPAISNGQQKVFYETGNNYEILREKSAFYFPWCGMEELIITLQLQT